MGYVVDNFVENESDIAFLGPALLPEK